MPNYQISFAKSAFKELNALPAIIVQRLIIKIEMLESNPWPYGCKKLQGPNNLWRLRSGDYRIVYHIKDIEKTVDIVRIKHRSKVYE